MKRRQFLKTSSALLSGSLLSQLFPFGVPQALAENSSKDHFFVLLKVEGGMDVTLGLEPRSHKDGSDQEDIFLEYREEDIITAGNILLGPAAHSLKNHYQDLLIINGINMRRDAGHEALGEYIASGNGDGKTAFLPIEIASTTQTGPMGVLSDQYVNLGKRKSVLTMLANLVNLSETNKNLTEMMALTSDLAEESFKQAVTNLIDSETLLENYVQAVTEYKDNNSNFDSYNNSHVIMALALKAGLCRQAFYGVGSDALDTHSNHEKRHLASQIEVWNQVAEIFSTFKSIEYKGKTLFDFTTFVVQTEFSRTPYLNAAKGKDHNPYTNSVLLAGKGVNGNQVIGGSHVITRFKSRSGKPLHFSTPFDFTNGNLITDKNSMNADTGLIFPENVVRTVAKIFGDPEGFSSVSLTNTKVIPGVTKDS